MMQPSLSPNNKELRADFRLNEWRVSPERDEIINGDKVVKLEPRVMDVLVFFADHQGELVTRDMLEQAVWRGALVGYDAVTGTIIKLRKALGDKARSPDYIATVPKRGYRLIAEVVSISQESEVSPAPEQKATKVAPSNLSVARQPAFVTSLIIFILVLLLGVAWLTGDREPVTEDLTSGNTPSILVLPFANMSGDQNQDYFADGITEDLITSFSRLANLRIMAWHTAANYKNDSVSPQEAGRQVDVRYVLTGSVRKAEDRVRISVQLISSTSGDLLWAERYDRELSDIFQVQDEVTQRIVSTLSLRISPSENQHLKNQTTTSNIDAYDAFLKGQQFVNERSRDGNARARSAFRKAISLDPSYARAYGALAVVLVHDFRNSWSNLPLQESQYRALELAQKAVELSPTSPQVRWVLGFVYLYNRMYDKAAAEAERAIELAPGYADALGLLASVNNFRGRHSEALTAIQKAISLNPHYPAEYPLVQGRALFGLGRYHEAIDALNASLDRNAGALYPRLMLAASYMRIGRLEDATWEIEQAQALNPGTRLSNLPAMFPVQSQTEMADFLEDLGKAGLPN